MGLCKCPKKKVTNLFCFEHRVNVCDHCLVDSHASCVVQSYLQWLTDSDFEADCMYCSQALNLSETVRLQCLHVVHWACLNEYASKLPPTTAPAGYRCITCNSALFPAETDCSPLVEKLREKLSTTNWARAGLGMALLPEKSLPVVPSLPLPRPVKSESEHVHHHKRMPANNETVVTMNEAPYSPENSVLFTARKKNPTTEHIEERPLLSNDRDVDSERYKYERRSYSEWFGGLMRARSDGRSILPRRRRGRIILLVIFLVFITFLLISTKSSESDPLLDPHANPNIRVADE